MDFNQITKITIDEVVNEPKNNRWLIYQTIELGDGSTRPYLQVSPYDQMEWRAAEYNINPSDLNTLIDIMICEQFIKSEWYHTDKSIWNSPTIENAREALISEIAQIKLKYRISTRAKDSPLQHVRSTAEHSSARMAVKGLETLLQRHERGVEELNPAVLSVLLRFKENLILGADVMTNGNLNNSSGTA